MPGASKPIIPTTSPRAGPCCRPTPANGRSRPTSSGCCRCCAAAHRTNIRMELTDAIMALEALKRPCAAELYTDSQYLRSGITEWIHVWKRNGWRTADKKPVRNVDLWQRLDAAMARHEVHWHWVRGHAGHALNERVDRLAREACAEASALV